MFPTPCNNLQSVHFKEQQLTTCKLLFVKNHLFCQQPSACTASLFWSPGWSPSGTTSGWLVSPLTCPTSEPNFGSKQAKRVALSWRISALVVSGRQHANNGTVTFVQKCVTRLYVTGCGCCRPYACGTRRTHSTQDTHSIHTVHTVQYRTQPHILVHYVTLQHICAQWRTFTFKA